MSTVRMSRNLMYELKDAYRSNVLEKLHTEKEFNPALADAIYNSTIGAKINKLKVALADSLGDLIEVDAFFVKDNELKVETSYTTYRCETKKDEQGNYLPDEKRDWEVISKTKEQTLRFPLSTERSFPAIPQKYSGGDPVTLKLQREESPELDQLVLVYEANSKQAAKDSVNVNKFDKFLNQFTTLNQALRAYPALDKLVRPEIIAKVHKKQERKRKQEAQKEQAINMDQSTKLTEDILTASLLGDE